MPLRYFLLATGERGIGWRPIFGDRRLTLAEFELYTYIQSRVMLVASEDGQKEMRRDNSIRKAIKIEKMEAAGTIPVEAPLDFSRMTQEQYDRWQKEQEKLFL